MLKWAVFGNPSTVTVEQSHRESRTLPFIQHSYNCPYYIILY